MALRDSLHNIAVYFGLAEARDEYDEEPEYDAREPERDLEERYRERPNVRRLSTRRRRDEIDDIFADDSPAERRTTRLRTVEPGAGTNGGGGARRESSRVHLVIPKSFNDAQDIADKFKDQIPVIVNLQGIDRDLSKRLVDFASGPDLRARRRHAADRREGLPAHAAQRRSVGRGARAADREGLLQPVLMRRPGHGPL